MKLLAAFLFYLPLISGGHGDLDGDKKDEKLFYQVYPAPRVSVSDLNAPPLLRVEVIIKQNGKYHTVGKLEDIQDVRATNYFKIISQDGTYRGIIIMRVVRPSGVSYVAVGHQLYLFPMPKELVE